MIIDIKLNIDFLLSQRHNVFLTLATFESAKLLIVIQVRSLNARSVRERERERERESNRRTNEICTFEGRNVHE